MYLRAVIKDVLDLCGGRVVVVFVELDDIKKLRIFISTIALEHKAVKEDVPTCDIIY
jgi:hypothetical protein